LVIGYIKIWMQHNSDNRLLLITTEINNLEIVIKKTLINKYALIVRCLILKQLFKKCDQQ